MERPWNIAEQVIEDPTTKMRIEFTSVHTQEIEQGRAAPLHDKVIYMRMWTTDRTRMATYAFTRAGKFIMAKIDVVDGQGGMEAQSSEALEKASQMASEAMNYNEDHPQGPVDSEGFGNVNYAQQFTGDI